LPRHPKTARLRANRERVDVGLLSVNLPIAAGPPAPAGVLKATRDAWAAFWRSPLARIVHPDTDGTALARLFTLYDERDRAYRVVKKRRLVEGSQGQPRANPLFAVMQTLDGEIRQLEDRFGMSPRARLVLGVTLGDEPTLDDLNADLADDDEDDPPDPRLFLVDRGAG
jgi:P27 family predicted phage terminase small subunit